MLSIIMGDAVPQAPWDLPLLRPKHDDKKGRTNARPHASVICCGARVASQRCPILRAGMKNYNKTRQR
jgi:hypothetical protein